MKFRSRKDLFFQIVLNGASLLAFLALYQELTVNKFDGNSIIALCVLIPVIIFIQWILQGTNYELTDSHFKYSSALFRGKIPLEDINELVVGKTMWAGFKPATARKGIIIKHGKFNEIYISPDSNESFVKKIKELNPNIKVTD